MAYFRKVGSAHNEDIYADERDAGMIAEAGVRGTDTAGGMLVTIILVPVIIAILGWLFSGDDEVGITIGGAVIPPVLIAVFILGNRSDRAKEFFRKVGSFTFWLIIGIIALGALLFFYALLFGWGFDK